MIIAIVCALAIISGTAKAIMDTLQFHYPTSVFANTTNWWNPAKSWNNKYAWAKGNAFLGWLLANPLVFITDAWHFFQAIFSVTFAASFFLSGEYLPWWSVFVVYVGSRLVFHVFFTWVFIRK